MFDFPLDNFVTVEKELFHGQGKIKGAGRFRYHKL